MSPSQFAFACGFVSIQKLFFTVCGGPLLLAASGSVSYIIGLQPSTYWLQFLLSFVPGNRARWLKEAEVDTTACELALWRLAWDSATARRETIST